MSHWQRLEQRIKDYESEIARSRERLWAYAPFGGKSGGAAWQVGLFVSRWLLRQWKTKGQKKSRSWWRLLSSSGLLALINLMLRKRRV